VQGSTPRTARRRGEGHPNHHRPRRGVLLALIVPLSLTVGLRATPAVAAPAPAPDAPPGPGSVRAFGDTKVFGEPGPSIAQPVVTIASTPSGAGYWLAARDGGIFTFGDAPFVGSAGALPLAKPIVGMAATPSGLGYWLVASDGGIFAFGDAPFIGGLGATPLSVAISGIARTPSGAGYWLVGADGGVFSFGDAPHLGSVPSGPPPAPVTAIAATPDGAGYWLLGRDGAVYAFGDARFAGRVDASMSDAVGLTSGQDGGGYLVATGGARVTAGTVDLSVPPFGLTGIWACIARHESGMDPRAVNPAGYYGLFQFALFSWHAVGGAGNPIDATPQEQFRRAQILQSEQGWSPWFPTAQMCGA